jgi:hypothetical protein
MDNTDFVKMGDEFIWEKIKENFKKNNASIQEIQNYLRETFDIEMKAYQIDVKPYGRWKYQLDYEIKELSNIVYIKCYIDKEEKSKPFICGITKTGFHGTTDFNFSDNPTTDNYNGRYFLSEEGLGHDGKIIYLFGTSSSKMARVLESHLQKRYNLFGS